jgi:hypothetical protein
VHRGQRAAEFHSDAGGLLWVTHAETRDDPAGVSLGELGSGGVHGLRRPGPDVGDAGAEHHPLGRCQQYSDLHEGVLAEHLVGPHGAMPRTFKPVYGVSLQIGMRGAVQRTRQRYADRPQGIAGGIDDCRHQCCSSPK